MTDATNAWISAYGGGKLIPLAPRAEDVDIRAIARSLSRPRWLNHTISPMTISHHSTLVGIAAEVEATRRGLDPIIVRACAQHGHLHDSGESLFPDVPGPYKKFLFFHYDGAVRSFSEVEEEAHCVNLIGLGLSPAQTPEIDEIVGWADLHVLAWEARDLVEGEHIEWRKRLLKPPPERLVPLSAEASEHIFLTRWRHICPDAAQLDLDMTVYGNCYWESKTYRRIDPSTVKIDVDKLPNKIPLPKGGIAGTPATPVWEDPDMTIYRKRKNSGT